MPGIFEPVLKDAEEEAAAEAEFNFGFDGKLLGSGMREDGFGNVNLMAFEGPPTVSRALEILKHQLEVVGKLQGEVEDLPLKAARLQTVLCDSSRRIRRLRGLKRDQEFFCKHLLTLYTKNSDNKG